MSTDLDKMLEAVVRFPSPADANAVFGAAATSESRVVIPAAAVAYDFELAGERSRQGHETAGETLSEPHHGWGRVRSRPVAVIELTPEETVVRPVVDLGRVLPRLPLLAGWTTVWVAFAIALRSRKRG